MKVQDLMTQEVEACGPATDVAAVSMIMWRQDCGIVPVVDDTRRLTGVITDRDICMALATRHRRAEELVARDLMSGEVSTVHPGDDVAIALDTMRSRRVRRLPVVDAERRLLGMLSINDVVLRAEPSGPRARTGLTANDVLATLQAVCQHPLPATRPAAQETLVAAHA
jgi:CBS-domain-containing membrane protein